MGACKGTLENAIIRFLIRGIIFAIAGPFISKILNGLTYALAMYVQIIFQASEASKGISQGLAVFIALVLIGILFYLPELMGRIVFRRVRMLAQRVWERWRKR
ncbi:MAG: hypothetical protein ACE5OV_02680 [Candidatus Bathyarchaeia archaeon]